MPGGFSRLPSTPTGNNDLYRSILDQRGHLNRMLRFWAQLERATAFSPSSLSDFRGHTERASLVYGESI